VNTRRQCDIACGIERAFSACAREWIDQFTSAVDASTTARAHVTAAAAVVAVGGSSDLATVTDVTVAIGKSCVAGTDATTATGARRRSIDRCASVSARAAVVDVGAHIDFATITYRVVAVAESGLTEDSAPRCAAGRDGIGASRARVVASAAVLWRDCKVGFAAVCRVVVAVSKAALAHHTARTRGTDACGIGAGRTRAETRTAVERIVAKGHFATVVATKVAISEARAARSDYAATVVASTCGVGARADSAARSAIVWIRSELDFATILGIVGTMRVTGRAQIVTDTGTAGRNRIRSLDALILTRSAVVRIGLQRRFAPVVGISVAVAMTRKTVSYGALSVDACRGAVAGCANVATLAAVSSVGIEIVTDTTAAGFTRLARHTATAARSFIGKKIDAAVVTTVEAFGTRTKRAASCNALLRGRAVLIARAIQISQTLHANMVECIAAVGRSAHARSTVARVGRVVVTTVGHASVDTEIDAVLIRGATRNTLEFLVAEQSIRASVRARKTWTTLSREAITVLTVR
jgi:hypothetical protein